MKRLGIWLCAGACSAVLWFVISTGRAHSAGADDKQANERAADKEYGTITGRFVLEGDIPQLKPLVAAGDVGVNNAEVCAGANIPDDSLAVDPKTKGIANVFVYLLKAEKVHPNLKESAKKEIDFDQKSCRFTPHALFVRTDQVVLVKSSDNCAHNTHTVSVKNQEQNSSLAANDRTGIPFKNRLPEKSPIKIECNIHPWMRAYWLVLDHPYGAVSDSAGKFTIADLPAGEHELIVWQERVGYVNRKFKVTVAGGTTTDVGTIAVPVAKFMDGN